MWRLLLASLLLLSTVAAAPRSPAQPPARDPSRGRAEAERKDAEAATAAAAATEQRLAAQRVLAAEHLRAAEAELSTRADAVAELAARRDATAEQLRRRADAIRPLLPLIQRLALFPAETLLAIPAGPEQAVRGLMVLRGMARRAQAEAAALRRDEAELRSRSEEVSAALPALDAARAVQAREAAVLDREIAAAHALRLRAEAAGAEAARRVAAEAARAESLRAALAQLEAARARAEAEAREDADRAERRRQDAQAAEARRRQDAMARPAGPPPEPRGGLTQPVAGRVVRQWGEATEAGRATGVSYRPAPNARVVAPCGGRVRFAGPFRSYGALVILDCGGGYAFVLAGLGRLDAAAGTAVLAGEPVGVMPDWNPAASGAAPALYLELRHDGQAVDPAPFLRRRS